MKQTIGLLVLGSCMTSALAQDTTTAATQHPHNKRRPTMQQMQDRIDKLEKLVEEMHAEMAARDKQLADVNKKADATQAHVEATAKQQQARAEETTAAVAKTNESVQAVQSSVAEVKQAQDYLTVGVQAAQARAEDLESPSAIRFMGVSLKPGGFLAAETVSRQRGTGSDINTQFSTLPFSGQTAAHFSEFNGSGRQSRVSLMAEGKLANATLRGYYETDFLSAGTTSNSNQSNSYTMRARQLWGQAELESGWAFTGGQMWSLATEYRSGLTNTKEAIPQTIDAQYNVGFTWARQYGFRVTKHIGDSFWFGTALEQAQTLNIGGHNLPAIVYQQQGNSGGLYNPTANYSYNQTPDLIAKAVYEPSFGHFELFAIGRFFRARVFPNAVSLNGSTPSSTPTAGAYNTKTQGGGLGLNAHVTVLNKHLELGAHVLAGDGIGRYATTTLADATERPDGSLELLSGGSALASAEWHASKRLDLYGYYGGEYIKRAYYPTGLTFTSGLNNGQPVLTGYGAPTNNVSGCNVEVAPVSSPNGGGYVPGSAQNCTADNRNIQEGTIGYWFRFYKGSKGTLQQGFQYSYAVRHTWLGIGDTNTGLGFSPKAINNMWFTSFRFYLPQ